MTIKSALMRPMLFAVLLSSLSMGALAKALPDPETHKAFLLNPYDESKPVLVAFKDPRCPYCTKAFKQKETLDNYNVFVFWSPILGNTSARQVETFFHCEQPMGEQVIEAVIERKQVNCDNEFNDELWALNDGMVKEYTPNSVPQYWFKDQKVWVTQLKLSMTNEQRIAALAEQSPMRVPWHRYADFSVNDVQKNRHNMALVFRDEQELRAIQTKIDSLKNTFNVFVFDANKTENEKTSEFLLLTNTSVDKKNVYFLEGKRLSQEELKLFEL